MRLTNTLMAAANSPRKREGPPLRIETMYDERRSRLKVIVVGGIDANIYLLKLIAGQTSATRLIAMQTNDPQRHPIDNLHDPDKNVRARTALELGKLADPATVHSLLQALATESDFFVRENLTWSLVRMADAAVPMLMQMLSDARPQARHGAAHTLSKIRDPRAVGALVDTLRDTEPSIVSKAAFALGAIGDVDSVPALVDVLGGEDRELQSTLVSVLEGFGTDAVAPLCAALGTHKPESVNTRRKFSA